MRFKLQHITFIMVTVFTVTMFFSCNDNLKEVQKIGVVGSQPASVSHEINTKYTDSGKLKLNLISSKLVDYSNREFPFSEFPEGINLTIYDNDNNASNVISDYAIIYNETDLIDLRGHVVLRTHNKDTLFAEQLYYDQKREWMFTNLPVKFRRSDQIINGNGFDSDKSFKNAQVLEVTGIIYLDE